MGATSDHGSFVMNNSWKRDIREAKRVARQTYRHARSKGRRSGERVFHCHFDSPPNSAEEREQKSSDPIESAYQHAARTADQKVRFYRDLVVSGLIVLPLLFLLPWLGVILLLVFGIGLVKRFFRLMVEPGMRQKFIDEEVGKHIDESVDQQRRSMQSKHARSLEQLSAAIAHEIRNPITAAKSLVQQMGEDPSASENVEYAQVALQELQRVERSISHLLRFARDEDLHMTDIKMSEVLDSALETFRDRAERSGITINRKIDCAGEMVGDGEKLRRVVINLVANAIDALEGADVQSPCIDVSMGENLAGSEIWIRFRDNGPGIDENGRSKVFNPFYTSKSDGTGLGLALTQKTIQAHAGEIELISEPGKGAEFLLTFPKEKTSIGS